MQHLEHDMDELFQKAAEHYPLKKSGSDWDAVAARIRRKTVTSAVKKTAGKKKYLLTALFLIFSLLLGGILLTLNQPGRNNFKNISSGEALKLDPDVQTEIPGKPDAMHPAGEDGNSRQLLLTDNNSQLIQLPVEVIINQHEVFSPEKPDHLMLRGATKTEEAGIKPRFSKAEKMFGQNPPSFTLHTSTLPVLDPPSLNTTLHPAKEHGIYWGLLAGPQFSQVKRQRITKTGFNLGLIAGYRFSDHIAIESGLFYSAKHYYSDGKYFTMSKPDPTMPANMTLMNIRGSSQVVEFPLKIRLDIPGPGRNRIFGTAGISSFILTSEKNNYHAMVNGTPEDMARSYHKNSHYAAAGLQFSAGFEHKGLNGYLLRIEPYLQIPLKGIGVGAIPVSSTGIHVGITRLKRNQ